MANCKICENRNNKSACERCGPYSSWCFYLKPGQMEGVNMPKEYTTIEAIQKLFEVPDIEFQCTSFSDGCVWKIYRSGNSVKWYSKSPNCTVPTISFLELSSGPMEKKWTLVQKPVDFMTAFKAWINENKSIYCIRNGMATHYDNLIDKQKGCFIAGDMESGQWFIDNGDI